ncbi:unnamed protein product [Nezara viridula]|uniref:Uncharacterized protein n=1 Tax=Nezara viridula TaxID=85310 RepID=A0A9P0EDW1_NEZVI|nr:unnamed protein product [Nezara viridula]
MYDSCPYGGGLELKRCSIKSEEIGSSDWYRFCNPSTFQQLKQSVEKAKAALSVSSAFTDLAPAFQNEDKRHAWNKWLFCSKNLPNLERIFDLWTLD